MAAKELRDNPVQIEMNLSDKNIGDEGTKELAKALEQHKSLQRLDLHANQIGMDGAEALAEALEQNYVLQELNLKYNPIAPEGTGVFKKIEKYLSRNKGIAAAKELDENSNLIKLNWFGKKIGDEGIKELAKALKRHENLQCLDLRENQIGIGGAEALAEALEQNRVLQELNLNYNTIVPEEIGVFKRIEKYLGRNRGIAAAKELRNNSVQIELNLFGQKIGEEGLTELAKAIKQHQKLEKLDLRENLIGDEATEALAEALTHNTVLRELDVSKNQIGARGVTALMRALKKNEALQEVRLRNNSIGTESIADIKQLIVYLGRNRGIAAAKELDNNSDLVMLDWSGQKIGDEGVKKLARALEQHKNLQKLDLRRNQISDEGAKVLKEVLTQNHVLQNVNLDENTVSIEIQKKIEECLNSNKNWSVVVEQDSVVEIDLLVEAISDRKKRKVMRRAVEMLLKNDPKKKKLNLRRKTIGDTEVKVLAAAIEKNHTLQQLDARPCGPSINMCESHISTIKLFGTEGKNNCSTVRGCGEQFCTVSVDRNESESHLMSLVNEKDREVEPLFSGRRPVGSTTTNPKEWKGRNNCRWSIIPAGSAGVVCREMMTEKVERSHWGEQRLQLGAQAVIARRFGSREKSESCIVAMKGRNWLRAKAGYLVDANREVRNE